MIQRLLVYQLHCYILECRMGCKNKKGEQGRNSIKFTVGFNELPFNVKIHKD
ncbi:hypothetical protein FLAVO9AF_40024 [Flavobacterium sp. 9AF]|nr:hypothetical protein FLAVO9AF_40024 [Flavobacterium sp. 9AF]